MVVAVIVAAGIISLSAVFTFVAPQVATDSSYLAAFGPPGSNALVLLLLEMQHYAACPRRRFQSPPDTDRIDRTRAEMSVITHAGTHQPHLRRTGNRTH